MLKTEYSKLLKKKKIMPEIKDKKYGKTLYYIDGNEIMDKKHGKILFYIDGSEVKEKSKYGTVKFYIDHSLFQVNELSQ